MVSSIRKLLFLNPPHPHSISRRYMCSYYSPLYLLPPHDLVQLATCASCEEGTTVQVLDAIAERLSEDLVFPFIQRSTPEMVIILMGVETFGEDMEFVVRLKARFPTTSCVLFGYYPTTYPEQVLTTTGADVILLGEPEEPLIAYLKALNGDVSLETIQGLAWRTVTGTIVVNRPQRNKNLDSLPFSNYGLLKKECYEEAFWGGPCGAILSSRGCPFPCTYCTTTFGKHLVMKSVENVVAEMNYLKQSGIRFVRFMDDTFTCNRTRVLNICERLIKENLSLPWACLSRVDTLDTEMLDYMARAGCKRIMVGVESYSQVVLDFLGKNVDAASINPQLELIRKAGIESIGFFMIGTPVETEEEFKKTLKGVVTSPLDFITVNIITPYGGTPFYEQMKEEILFQFNPFRCEFKDTDFYRRTAQRKRRLYATFYLRPSQIFKRMRSLAHNPIQGVRLLWLLSR